jgi:hypothetical protein
MENRRNSQRPPLAPGAQSPVLGLTASALLAPANYRTVDSKFSDTANKKLSGQVSNQIDRSNLSETERILEEIEKTSSLAQDASGKASSIKTSTVVAGLGPKVLTQQTANRSTSRAVSRELPPSSELKVQRPHRPRSASPMHRSPSPGVAHRRTSLALSPERSHTGDDSSMSATKASKAGLKPDERGAEKDGVRLQTTQSTGSDLDSHLSPEQNPWVVLEELRKRPESSEFRYMMPYRKDSSTPPNPYHLKVMPHEKCDKNEYFTLSLHGVTHFVGGRPEFTDLEQWKRERFLFDSVIQIPFFQRYRWWKAFKVWKIWVKYGKMEASRKFLQKNLLLANPTLLKMLHQLRVNCFGLFTIPLCSDAAEGMHTLEEFSRLQEVQRGHVLKHLEAFWLQTLANAKSTFEKVLNDIEEDFTKKQHETKQAGIAAASKPGEQSKMISAALSGNTAALKAKLDDGMDFKYTIIAAKRSMHKNLFNFTRLCDYIVFSALHAFVVRSVEILCRRFTENQQVMFICDLITDGKDLKQVPNNVQFTTEVDGIVGSFALTASSGTRLLGHPEINPYIDLYESNPHADPMLVHQIITQDEVYQRLLEDMHMAAVKEFRKSLVALDELRPFVQTVVRNAKYDFAAMEAEAISKRTDFKQFVRLISEFRKQISDIDDLPVYIDYSVVRLQLDKFKARLAPSSRACIAKLSEILPKLLISRCKKMQSEVSGYNAGLGRNSRSVEEFVAYVDFVEKVERRQTGIDEEVAQIEVCILCVCVCVCLCVFMCVCVCVCGWYSMLILWRR